MDVPECSLPYITFDFVPYHKGKTAKDKLSVENESVKISHTKDDASARASLEEWQIQTFEGDAMVVSIPNVFKDTWKKIR